MHTSTATRSYRDPETAVIQLLLPGGVRRRTQCVTSAAEDATRCGHRRFYYGRYRSRRLYCGSPPTLLRLLLVLLYSQFD